MTRRTVLLAPFALLFRKRKLAYETPTLTCITYQHTATHSTWVPFTLPKATGPFVPRGERP